MDSKPAMRLFRTERGSAVVEFAFVLPVILLLTMFLIEGGSMVRGWLTVQKSAQMAVRFATTGQGDEEGQRLSLIKEEAKKLESSLPGLSPAMQVDVCSRPGLDMAAPCAGDDPGGPCQMVEVRTSFSYAPFTPLFAAVLPPALTIEGTERGINEPWKACP